ncbi:nucleotide modification associated domain-containing protein [Blattabacterium cuenoti]|uniref:nucleotide modification associated domain-containing protein n=1 Tax=Blattabacterium cuenoti TaxID=1653831 RepID=UPI00163CF5B9|nr:nucleotide modification associated domain-containing protein [Blattabacterium cuenoti]
MNHISIDLIMEKCEKIFKQKLNNYDLSWKCINVSSIVDQIFMKIIRIQNIQKKGYQKVEEEKIMDTHMDIINYILIILIKKYTDYKKSISHYDVIKIYSREFYKIKLLYNKKNWIYSFSIEDIVNNIFLLKKKEKINSKELKIFCLKMLNVTLTYLKKNIF